MLNSVASLPRHVGPAGLFGSALVDGATVHSITSKGKTVYYSFYKEDAYT
jgi:hypothetical protein